MLTIVKIGGNVIDDKSKLADFLSAFAKINTAKILVHGGGKIATDIGLKLGIQPAYVDGRRITDKETLDLVTMVYGGLINKNIVAELQTNNCNAIGLTGADASLIKASKRPAVNIDYGFVGDVNDESVNTTVLKSILDNRLVPVFAALTYSNEGVLLNTNADTIAQVVARAMARVMDVQLIYCFDKDGVLDAQQSVIRKITETDLEHLKISGVVKDGMLPKLANACEAVKAGVKRVVIGNAADLDNMNNGSSGTEIV